MRNRGEKLEAGEGVQRCGRAMEVGEPNLVRNTSPTSKIRPRRLRRPPQSSDLGMRQSTWTKRMRGGGRGNEAALRTYRN
jgi:hypothetical protein